MRKLWAEIGTFKRSKKTADEALNSKEKEYMAIPDENQQLSDYLAKAGINVGYKNTGKQISELGKKQQCGKIIELKANVKESLWFANTFELTMESAVFSDENGSNMPLNFHATP